MLVAEKRKKVYTNKKRKPKKKMRKGGPRGPKNKEVRMKLSILLYALIIVFSSIFLLSRYVKTTRIQKEVTEKSKQIEGLQEKQSDFNLELEEIKDSGLIEEQAKLRINLRKAKEDQIIYLDLK